MANKGPSGPERLGNAGGAALLGRWVHLGEGCTLGEGVRSGRTGCGLGDWVWAGGLGVR